MRRPLLGPRRKLPWVRDPGGATDDGRAANVAVTMQLTDPAAMKPVDTLVDKALCSAG